MISHKEFNSKFFEIGLRTSYFLFSGRKMAPALRSAADWIHLHQHWTAPLRVDNELNLHEQFAHAGRMKNLISSPLLF